jgi:hypothetical protein
LEFTHEVPEMMEAPVRRGGCDGEHSGLPTRLRGNY